MALPVTYIVEPTAVADRHLLKDESCPVPTALSTFVQDLIEIAMRNNGQSFTTSALKQHLENNKRANSSATLSKHIKALREAEVLAEEQKIDPKTKNRFLLYRITSLTILISHCHGAMQKVREGNQEAKGRPSRKTLRQQLDLLESQGYEFISSGNALSAKSDKLFGFLSGGLRSGIGDRRKLIRAQYLIGKESLQILTKTESGDDDNIPEYRDIRFVHSLATAAHDYFRRTAQDGEATESLADALADTDRMRELASKPFVIDVYDETRKIFSNSNIENRREYLKVFRRWASTTFYVDADKSPLFRSKFMPENTSRGNYRLIQQYWAGLDTNAEPVPVDDVAVFAPSDESDIDERTRFIVLRMEPIFLLDAIHPNFSYDLHRELLREKSGLVQRLYIFLKAIITVTDTQRHRFTFWELYLRAFPGAQEFHNVRRDLLAAAKKRCNDEDLYAEHPESTGPWRDIYDGHVNVFWMHGFYVEVKSSVGEAEELRRMRRQFADRKGGVDQEVVWTVWRDREDSLLGDESPAARAAKRSIQKESTIKSIEIPPMSNSHDEFQ